MTFGQRLQLLRKENGLSQEELAKLLYVTRQSVSLWENDKTMPAIDLLVKLSSIFHISTDELLGKSLEPPKPTAKADILSEKCEIKNAMGYTRTTSINVLFSVAIGFSVMTLFLILITSFSINQSNDKSASNVSPYLMFIYVFIFLCISFVLLISKKLSISNAQKFMKDKNGYMLFYTDYLTVFTNGDENPKSIPYYQFNRIINGDRYIVFKTYSGEIYCADKQKAEGYFDAVLFNIRAIKGYKDKSVLKANSKTKRNTKQLQRMKSISDILFVQSFFSLYYLIMLWGFLMNTKTEATYLIYLSAIIPLSGLVIGIIYKAMHMRGVKLIVTSSIMLVFTLLYSSIVIPVINQTLPPMPELTEAKFIQTAEQNGFCIKEMENQYQIQGAEKYLVAKRSDKDYELVYVSFENNSSTRNYYEERKDTFCKQNSGYYSMQQDETIYEGVFSIVYGNSYLYIYRNENSVLRIQGYSEDMDEILAIVESMSKDTQG